MDSDRRYVVCPSWLCEALESIEKKKIAMDIQKIDQNTFSKVAETVYNEIPEEIAMDIQKIDQNTFSKVAEIVYNGKVPEEIDMDIQKIDQNTFSKVAETVYNVIPG
ncbi:unnamed protein product [Macrosiphum euphorbiae]|uniref:Uncharacterized protein n=1 Tax=Macrosiphum euphorbiae TaxID=13131 RepID=A0AAV0VM04_9HEMI|nr:unnamed protein product [Macrosiphum euphorbiae]